MITVVGWSPKPYSVSSNLAAPAMFICIRGAIMTESKKTRRRRSKIDCLLRTSNGRFAGNGIISDDYAEYASAETKQSKFSYRHVGCTLPFEYGSDPYLNEDWENVKRIISERKKGQKRWC